MSQPDGVPRDARAIARLISLVEDGGPELRDVMAGLAPQTGRARVIGLTGSPGVGKSTTTAGLISAYRREGLRVGVLAIDPSSPFSGGALLGDRVRMQEHAGDDGVYIRSMASRGHLGGLSRATPQAVRVLDAAGFDVVLVETVGVGQAEVDVAALADTTVVLLAPGMGDSIQAAKAGILEVADVLVVNKADRDGANNTVRDLQAMLSYAESDAAAWSPPIVRTIASEGTGLAELVGAIEAHRSWAHDNGQLVRRRIERASAEVRALLIDRLHARLDAADVAGALLRLASEVAEGKLDAYAAADELAARSA
ncbi:MAG: methylmalonyl Co-A mutase-associated GTPase MeaB [Mycobacteriales bacterium]